MKLPQTAAFTTASTPELPLDGYLRVSYPGGRHGERFLSPRLQEQAIRAYAHGNGAALGRIFVELGRSGTDPKRPQLAAALARIEDGKSGGLIVARLDRLGRSVVGTLRLLEQIEQAGGRFVSVEDGFDSTTPLGRALLTVMLALAQLELDRLADSTREARTRAVMRGAHRCRLPPRGYRLGADGRLEPDPAEAPPIVAAFERRAAGASYNQIAAFLADSGVPPPTQAAVWSGRRAYRLFQNPIYVGEAFSGETRNPDAHPPLVRRALWLAAHAAAATAYENAQADSLLAGIARCGSCQHPLRYWPSQARSPDEPRARPSRYACRRHFRLGDCPAPAAAAADPLEHAVVSLCLRRLDAHRPRPQLDAELHAAEARLAALEASAARHEYQSAVYTRASEELVAARRTVLGLWRRLQLAQLPPTAELRRSWPRLPRSEQRRILQTALDGALLLPGTATVEERLSLVYAGSRDSRSAWRRPASLRDHI